MTKIKNITFPMVVRRLEASDNNLIGYFPLAALNKLKILPKEKQFLVYYNFQNERLLKRIEGRNKTWSKPYFIKSTKRAYQTTLVLDFDKLVPSVLEGLDLAFERFKNATNGKAMMVTSPSGNRHVIYVLSFPCDAMFFNRLQESVINGFFKEFKFFLDDKVSKSINYGFFHSQHFSSWIEQDKLNLSPSAQGHKKKIWAKKVELSFNETLNLLELGTPYNTRNSSELARAVDMMLGYLCFLLQRGEHVEKERKDCAAHIYRALAASEARRTDGKSTAEEISAGAKTEKYQAAIVYLTSDAGEAVCRANGLQSLFEKLVNGYLRRRAASDSQTDGIPQTGDGSSSIQGSSGEGSGYSNSSNSWDDRVEGNRHNRDSSTEYILDIIQNVKVRCNSRGVEPQKLGEQLRTYSLRSNRYGHTESEKSDIDIFFTILREIVATDSRIRRDFGITPECTLSWLRHAASYLRSRKDVEGSICQLANDAVSCWRLCSEAQDVQINPEYLLSEQLFETVFEAEFNTLTSDFDKRKKQIIQKHIKEEKQSVMNGLTSLLNYMYRLRGVINHGKPVAIGLNEFQNFFNVHIQKAALIRLVVMRFFASSTVDYIPHIKRREFVINIEKFNNFISKTDTRILNVPMNAQDLIPYLGDSKTWDSIRTLTPSMVKKLGLSKTREVWYSALTQSEVNQLDKRIKDVESFLQRISRQESTNAISIER